MVCMLFVLIYTIFIMYKIGNAYVLCTLFLSLSLIYIYIYIYHNSVSCHNLTSWFVADQMRYNLESAQYL